jgi:hypothetical protein
VILVRRRSSWTYPLSPSCSVEGYRRAPPCFAAEARRRPPPATISWRRRHLLTPLVLLVLTSHTPKPLDLSSDRSLLNRRVRPLMTSC